MSSQVLPRQVLFGLTVDAVTLDQVVERAEWAMLTRERLMVGVVNAAKVVRLKRDRLLQECLVQCDMILADVQSVVWASRLLRRPLPERVTGIDLFEALLEVGDRTGRRVYFLGARPEVLDTVLTVVAERWPGLKVAGHQHGYFPPESDAAVAAAISDAHADMLFIAMTTPRKEQFIGTYCDRLGTPVMHGVGGSFDVLAGVTVRAPRAWQRYGMEWAYRLRQEPRRLWKRYLVTNTAFALLLAAELIHPRPAYAVRPTQPHQEKVHG